MQRKNIFIYGACLLPVAATGLLFIGLAAGYAAYPIFLLGYTAVFITGAVCELVTFKLYGCWWLGLKWGEWACMAMIILSMLTPLMPTVETHCRFGRHLNVQSPAEMTVSTSKNWRLG